MFLVFIGLEARHYAETIQGSVLPNTPIHASIILIILLCLSTSFQRVDTFAYIHFFYTPLILLPILVVLIPSFQDMRLYNITPILGNNPTWGGFMKGAVVVAQAIGNIIVITMIIPFMQKPKKAIKGALWGLLVGGLVVISITTVTVGVFGENEIKNMYWPFLNLGRMVNIPADVLSRIDALLIISWIYGVFTTLLSYYFLMVRGFSEVFQVEHYRMISIMVAPIIYLISIVPDDIYTMYDYILLFSRYSIVPLLAYPYFLLLIAVIRKKKGAIT